MEINYNSIGVFQCKFSRPFEVHRQGVLSSAQSGFIQIFDSIDLQCLEDIEGFERIWVIYDFHLNKSYRPKVRTPRVDVPKKGVFATRSPYRPNSIGLSCVKLERLEGRKLWISEFDILNESPILDIKPYLAYADSFENAKSGWVPKMKHFSFVYEERAA
ncbi:MAG: tRNA (N6-threonylcarbamoyladenosine(37)-N6)-methyltransferase TrmO, partial [Bdellovibrionales bacterium]|nr:tRNA (N6-threonylcarbamoyladenosine(37)-N6)-methyltransferase TrmO [Bdellovibrionales bacterium]